MSNLLFEIWRDDAENDQMMWQVSKQSDKVRLATMPNAVLVHTFTAASDFDAFQQNYDWNGWGIWRPEPDWLERTFTEGEAAEQQAYLTTRNGT